MARFKEGTDVRWAKKDGSIRFGIILADADGAPGGLKGKIIVAVREENGEWPVVIVDCDSVTVLT